MTSNHKVCNLIGNRSFMVVGSSVLVINEKGQLLLQQKKESAWCLPGSLMELGETLEETARRAVYEEAGLVIGSLQLLRVFSGKKYIFRFEESEAYAVTAVYVTRDILGEITKDEVETNQVQYFDFTMLPENIESEDKDFIQTYLKRTLPSVPH
ncbi:NUDIX hydrolase [Lihuaxuella thermophila]|uniref:ADP-ribose pyrophosphatase YjhB, NUDIX family n=1 Tax=Lihuaxuella thermophila TaxID=1173111 RepID=A0A1H8BR85_9BACL|nr:NUDIX domain-containing protein [Lihuaxuella thermophila]SEM85282.1 ADP-ribose pyrophosphatase YjhB, NUDIX family [Lihuaxuella thermophila]